MAEFGRGHISLVVCGHCGSGKSTATGHMLFEFGCYPEHELRELKAEADRLGKSSSAFAFYMDRQKEERERGITISCKSKAFYTAKWFCTIIDAPGHRDFIKNMIIGGSQADAALLMVPADGDFTAAISIGHQTTGEIQGQTRQHARLINLLGVKQLIVGVNKMDSDTAGYKQERYDEVASETKKMLEETGWKKEFIDESVPVLPISGWMGDNLIKASEKMTWWKGVECKSLTGRKVHVHTLLDALDNLCVIPPRDANADMRMPISGIYKIKGVGDVLTGRVEQGIVKPNQDVVFLPTHRPSVPCTGKIISIEMQNQKMDEAKPGDNVGCTIMGLNEENMPQVGDVMIYKEDSSLKQCKSFTAQVQILDIPGEIKVGYSPLVYAKTGHSTSKLTEIHWKMGDETGGKRLANPHSLKSNETAECTFQPLERLIVETVKACEGLSRIAVMEDDRVVMLGTVISCESEDGQ